MSDKVFCRGCGKEIHSSAKSCPHCGAVQSTSYGEKNRLVAALLALFLGSLGAHKFYLGRIFQGVMYLLFCWTLIPGVIAFVEFIIYLCTSDEKFAEKYG
ncbi:TM2 domain-containing protein [Pantoea sp. 1.19]|uniref:TM2 domain-containing protein n=1 Tax=Pantoea sp. 1.19 TaxID=1925589 RepID=UPI000948A612|nr:TM2 domain-containing protein [Pantoea sp. 1.19]